MGTRRLGEIGEELAVRYLRGRGMRLVARNWRCAAGDLRGELDIVAWDGRTLVFCEVKARRGVDAGGPLVAVTARKQQQVSRLAVAFLAVSGVRCPEVRFDVVGVCWSGESEDPEITHVPGAW